VAYVGGLEVEEVEEGGVVHGGGGPRRGDSRGIGGGAVITKCERERESWAKARNVTSTHKHWIFFYCWWALFGNRAAGKRP